MAFTPFIALEGPTGSGKTHRLIKRAIYLLQNHPSSQSLIFCSNYYRKDQFLQAVQKEIQGGFSQLPVTTFFAFVRNHLQASWPLVESKIDGFGTIPGYSVLFPELSGFEASEYLIRKLIQIIQTQNPQAFFGFQGSEKSLVTQLIRRLRLRSENGLSRKDMRHRSSLINEQCLEEVEAVLSQYERWCYALRVLDTSKQLDVFYGLLEENPHFRQQVLGDIRHLIVDDVDETIPAQQTLIKLLAPQLHSSAIAADMDGGTRRGYLNAYPYDWMGLKMIHTDTQTIVLQRTDSMVPVAQRLLHNWTEETIQVLPIQNNEVTLKSQTFNRIEMLDQVVTDITQSIQSQKAKPSDFVIVLPRADSFSRLLLQKAFRKAGIPLQILTGTDRPTDHPTCRSLVWLLQLAYQTQWQWPLSPLEFKGLLSHGLKLHQIDPEGLEEITHQYRTSNLESGQLPSGLGLNEAALGRYQSLLLWLSETKHRPLDELIYEGFRVVLSPYLTQEDDQSAIQQLLRSLFIIPMAETFHQIQGQQNGLDNSIAAQEWLIQIKTGVIADTPNKPREIDMDAVVLGTPQKMIDCEVRRPIQCWLDISSREWSRTDNAPLYNAWVHSVNWDGNTHATSDAFNLKLTRTRAGHITRSLAMQAQKEIWLYQSELDDSHRPNAGMLMDVLRLPQSHGGVVIQKATLREDQAPILNYQNGAMAVTAVPGAGKTFVTVQLLLELIERGIPPESIVVLTYMDSAAKTLMTRLKKALQGAVSTLPIISTMHSLAFRIITEADHALYLGLDVNTVDIIDEAQSRAILNHQVQVYYETTGQPLSLKSNDILRGISTAKSYRLSPEALLEGMKRKQYHSERLRDFIEIYSRYQTQLQQMGSLDFTDLILKAIELLESREDVREKYQARFAYILEDEAQDSSYLLQQLISLLKGPQGNIVRVGDTNQSITTTFSTAEPQVFREFIAHCQQTGLVVSMNQSGRCATEVMELANAFLAWANEDDILKNAFQPIQMKGVPGHNPKLVTPITSHVFETASTEQNAIIQQIETQQNLNPEATMAILLRQNQDVITMAKALQAKGIKAISYTDVPELNPIFLILTQALRVLEFPAETARWEALADQYLQYAQIQQEQSRFLSLSQQDEIKALLSLAYGQNICQLMVELTDIIFTTPEAKSVGYLCAIKAQEVIDAMPFSPEDCVSPLEYLNRLFEEWCQSGRLPRGFKALSEIDTAHKPGFVHIMTLHKAKGQEFDLVWLPGLTESRFNSELKTVSLGESEKLDMEFTRIRSTTPVDFSELTQIKRLQKAEEEARLVYVGLTRARKALFISAHLSAPNRWGKVEKQIPSRYFEILQDSLAAPINLSGVTQ